VLLLGVQPVGTDLWELYGTTQREFVGALGLPLSEAAISVGVESPSLEVIAQPEPDLIVSGDPNTLIYDGFTKIVPTLILPDLSGGEGLDMQRSTFMAFADALNRHDRGVQVLDSLDTKLQQTAARMEAAGLADSKFILTQPYTDGMAPLFYTAAKNSAASQAVEKIGMQNAITTDEPDGIIALGMESLSTFDGSDTHFFYIDYSTMATVEQSSVWQGLEFVQSNQAYKIGENHAFYGPRSIERVVELMTDALTGS
jgi:ferric hydroxamate transport system substrate-binding protein